MNFRSVAPAIFTGPVVGCALAMGIWAATASAQTTDAVAVTPPVATAKKPATSPAKVSAKPAWSELTPTQQRALKPLAANWESISEGHKRKWLAISQNFASLPVAEQNLMHGRMTEWAALSPQERAQARLNYAGARELPPDERLAKWQAYQALSPEQRQKLAATAPSKPVGAATAIKPVSPQKLAVTPVPVKASSTTPHAAVRHTPKIAASPDQLDLNTLLPQSVPVNDASTSP